MKLFSITATLVALLLPALLFAQAPFKFNYQGVARDASGNLLANQAIGLRISIISGSPTGTDQLIETHAPTTNDFGLFNIEIGGGTIVLVNPAFDLGTDAHFVKVEMDATGGINYIEMGTSQLLSVPYALYAAESGTGGAPGPTGPAGPSGADGTNGATGATGPSGTNGTNGSVGATGPTGATGSFDAGTTPGEMNYWDGSAWVAVTPGQDGQTLSYCVGVPTWGPCPTAQARLNAGETPCDLYDGGAGFPLDSLYGRTYLGGLIFHFNTTTCQGLVATPTFLLVASSGDHKWGCEGTLVGASGSAIGTGYQNTQDILTGCGTAQIAAELCTDLGPEWFMPSIAELNLVYTNLYLNNHGNFFATTYWSSSERDATFAHILNFNDGIQYFAYKESVMPVHAVRAF